MIFVLVSKDCVSLSIKDIIILKIGIVSTVLYDCVGGENLSTISKKKEIIFIMKCVSKESVVVSHQ